MIFKNLDITGQILKNIGMRNIQTNYTKDTLNSPSLSKNYFAFLAHHFSTSR